MLPISLPFTCLPSVYALTLNVPGEAGDAVVGGASLSDDPSDDSGMGDTSLGDSDDEERQYVSTIRTLVSTRSAAAATAAAAAAAAAALAAAAAAATAAALLLPSGRKEGQVR